MERENYTVQDVQKTEDEVIFLVTLDTNLKIASKEIHISFPISELTRFAQMIEGITL